MAELVVDADPSEVGLDAARLQRIDAHFGRYVDQGRLAGWSVAVSRHGSVVHVGHRGLADVEAERPVDGETLWRIYSMTKPVTSVAVMMLYERGLLQLTDPLETFIPAFADMRVYRAGGAAAPGTDPAAEPIRIWHLLTHTAGLTYGFCHAHAVDEMYRSRGYEFGAPGSTDLEQACEAFARFPLVHQPGQAWNYGVATDVLGRVVEVVSGQTLDAFFAEHILGPLGMADTGFHVPDGELDRLAELYTAKPDGSLRRSGPMAAAAKSRPTFLSGGGGLVSTLADYHRFTQMLLHRGELDGVRVLGSRTVDLMTRNHLPGGVDLERFGRPIFAETSYAGVGFGLGFSVVTDPVAGRSLASEGEFAWGGLASTAFWVDPVERITAVFMTQLMPSSTYPIRPALRTLVMQALVD